MNRTSKLLLWGYIIIAALLCPVSGHGAEKGEPEAGPGPKINASIVTETAQLREGPSVFATVLAQLKKGDMLLVKEKMGEWYSAQLQNGTSGWLHQSVIAEITREMAEKFLKTAAAEDKPAEGVAKEGIAKAEKPPDSKAAREMVIKMDNHLMSVNFLNVDIREALSAIALEREINISAANEVSGMVTVHLFNVTLDNALQAITMAGGFAYRKMGDLYYVYKPKTATDPRILDNELKVTKLEYIEADKVQEILKGNSDVGTVKIHKESNTVIIEDSPENIKKVESIISRLDRMPRQVMIEAKILEVSLTDDMSFGINWNDILKQGAIRLGTGGFSTATMPTTVPVSPVPATGSGLYGNIITRAGTKEQFTAALDILQTKTRINILSTPKILAVHGKPAKVQVGGQQGYRVTTTNVGVATETIEFIDTGTILDITPFIDDNGKVLLNVKPSINSAKIEGGVPVVSSTTVSTWLVAKDGETVFIGGLIQDAYEKTREMIPCLGGIPGVGAAFGRTTQGNGKSELIVLITPEILDMDLKPSETAEAVKRIKKAEEDFNKPPKSSLRQFWDFLKPVQ